MSCDFASETFADNVGDIVNKTKILVDRLRLAIMHQDNLTKDCFETTRTDLIETVENIKKTHKKLEEEHEDIKNEVKAGEQKLSNLEEEFEEVVNENIMLEKAEDGLLDQNNVLDDFRKTANALKNKLQTYKKITGVRFDYSESDDVIIGYIGIPGDKSSKGTLIPFEIDKNNSNCKEFLWQKISEACEEINNCSV